MHKLLLTALLTTVAIPALAADLPGKAPRQTPVAAFNWAGFYAGVNGGYGWGDRSVQEACSPAIPIACEEGLFPQSLAADPKGGIFGGQIGANLQAGRLVLGIEADAQWANIRSKETISTSIGSPFFNFDTTAEQKIDFFGTVRARFGVVVADPFLLYATGGLAYGRKKLTGSIEMTKTGTTPACTGICAETSTSETGTGWVLGGGAEYAFAQNWSLKVEYLRYDLGSLSHDIVDSRFPTSIVTQSVDFKGNIVRGGLNYRF
jgi:outer membrane immunogenic protein